MNFHKKSVARRVAILCLVLFAATLTPSGKSQAQEIEVADVMEVVGEAYEALVKAIMLVPVLELASDTPYGEIARRAKEIENASKQLPFADSLKGDQAVVALSHQLRGRAALLRKSAAKNNFSALSSPLIDLRRTCLQCHSEYRF